MMPRIVGVHDELDRVLNGNRGRVPVEHIVIRLSFEATAGRTPAVNEQYNSFRCQVGSFEDGSPSKHLPVVSFVTTVIKRLLKNIRHVLCVGLVSQFGES